ncbi:MAG: trypsin-like serine protease [Myxococcota bacterium]
MKLPRLARRPRTWRSRGPRALRTDGVRPSILVYKNDEYVDKDVLEFAELSQFDPIVLILTGKGQATGTLVNVGRDVGKVILTAAHVIEDGVRSVYLEGAPINETEGSPSMEVEVASTKASPNFERGNDDTRRYDYGVIVLKDAVDTITPYTISNTCPTRVHEGIVNVGGYGDYVNTSGANSKALHKRVFHSLVRTDASNCSVLFSDSVEKIDKDPTQGIYWGYPWEGDSGGPVFTGGVFNQVAGVVSGKTADDRFAYARPSANDIVGLLT